MLSQIKPQAPLGVGVGWWGVGVGVGVVRVVGVGVGVGVGAGAHVPMRLSRTLSSWDELFLDLVHEAGEVFPGPRELFLCVLFVQICFEIDFPEFLDELI